jgi:transcriptional regulator with XRE-family HTH domain
MATRDSVLATSPLRVFGTMLRHYRGRAGMSQEQLAGRVYCSADLIAKIEKGQRTPAEKLTGALDDVPQLRTDGALTALRDSLKEALKLRAYPGWFHEWPDKEATAKTLRSFQPLLVPGLLQTEDYARALYRTRVGITDDEIDELVAARLARQDILDRDKPPMLWAILTEAVLRLPVGGKDVMRAQVNHVIEMARRPSVVLQVVPTSVGAHVGLQGGAFVIADFDDGPSVAYQDTAVRGQVIEDSDDVASLVVTWDTIKSEALPRAASLALVEEIAKTWT